MKSFFFSFFVSFIDVSCSYDFICLKETCNINILSSKRRQEIFEKNYSYERSESTFIISTSLKGKQSPKNVNTGCDLYISSSLWDQKYVDFITNRLRKIRPDLSIQHKLQNSELKIVEAKCVVIIMSTNYMKSPKEVDELNFILSKERAVKVGRHMYVVKIKDSDTFPTYVQLLHYDTSLSDELWEDFVHQQRESRHGNLLNDEVVTLNQNLEKEFKEGITEEETMALLKVVCDLHSVLTDNM